MSDSPFQRKEGRAYSNEMQFNDYENHSYGRMGGQPYSGTPPWWDIRQWSRRRLIIAAAVIVILIIVIIVAAVVGSKKSNSYPNYSPLTYTLKDQFSGTSFFDNFDYFTGYDPTFGFVHYVPQAQAAQLNLTYASSTSAVLRVDTSVTPESVPNADTGRFSVRITSKTTYESGLFIFDVLHTPLGCGTWPALWLTDPSNWPNNGEIDVMEAVNVLGSTENQMTLHTSSGCQMNVERKETGKSLSTTCANTTDSSGGCGVHGSSSSFGSAFNNNGGGIVAMELRSAGIRMWQFARNAIPTDITSGSPNPAGWGEAAADFPSTHCDIDTHFRNQSIIANIDLCGSWAGDPHYYNATCPGTCTNLVANNASAFTDAFWEFGAFLVYQAS